MLLSLKMETRRRSLAIWNRKVFFFFFDSFNSSHQNTFFYRPTKWLLCLCRFIFFFSSSVLLLVVHFEGQWTCFTTGAFRLFRLYIRRIGKSYLTARPSAFSPCIVSLGLSTCFLFGAFIFPYSHWPIVRLFFLFFFSLSMLFWLIKTEFLLFYYTCSWMNITYSTGPRTVCGQRETFFPFFSLCLSLSSPRDAAVEIQCINVSSGCSILPPVFYFFPFLLFFSFSLLRL